MDCILKLNALVFDEITFKRIDLHNESELEISMSVKIGINKSEPDIKKVSLRIHGEKSGEYTFDIQASGYFSYEGEADDDIIEQNAVAIVMPYVRSEVSILTAQPGLEPVVLPPFNIAEMMRESKKDMELK